MSVCPPLPPSALVSSLATDAPPPYRFPSRRFPPETGLSGPPPSLPLRPSRLLTCRVVLVRVDHNVPLATFSNIGFDWGHNTIVAKIRDPHRIDATLATLYHIAAAGGKPILMARADCV